VRVCADVHGDNAFTPILVTGDIPICCLVQSMNEKGRNCVFIV